MSEFFSYFNWYKKGFLPDEGGWLDQPNAFVQIIGWMDICQRDAEEQKREQDEKRAKLRNRLEEKQV